MNQIKTYFGWINTSLAGGDLLCFVGDQCAGYLHRFKVGRKGEACEIGFNLEHVYVLNSTTFMFYVFNVRTKILNAAELLMDNCKYSVLNTFDAGIPQDFPNRIFSPSCSTRFPAIAATVFGAYVFIPFSESTYIYTITEGDIVLFCLDKVVVQVSSGNNHITLFTSDNAIFCLGSGSRGELGQEQILSDSDVPLKVTLCLEKEEEKVVQIHAGGWHNIILSNAGNIYTWGLNDKEQCGLYNEAVIQKVPCLVKLPKTVRSVSAEQKATSITFVDGEVLRF